MKAQSFAPADIRPVATDPALLRETVGAIAILTLNRPRTRNTLTEALLAALGAELSAIAADRAVHAVVLTAKGPAFSGGHDPSRDFAASSLRCRASRSSMLIVASNRELARV